MNFQCRIYQTNRHFLFSLYKIKLKNTVNDRPPNVNSGSDKPLIFSMLFVNSCFRPRPHPILHYLHFFYFFKNKKHHINNLHFILLSLTNFYFYCYISLMRAFFHLSTIYSKHLLLIFMGVGALLIMYMKIKNRVGLLHTNMDSILIYEDKIMVH